MFFGYLLMLEQSFQTLFCILKIKAKLRENFYRRQRETNKISINETHTIKSELQILINKIVSNCQPCFSFHCNSMNPTKARRQEKTEQKKPTALIKNNNWWLRVLFVGESISRAKSSSTSTPRVGLDNMLHAIRIVILFAACSSSLKSFSASDEMNAVGLRALHKLAAS